MPRFFSLIVNPSSGGGRAVRVLPAVEAAMRARGLAFRVQRTSSIEHGEQLGREALAAGEVAVTLSGDGLAGRVAHVLRDTGGVLAVLPGGRGNDFARKLGIPGDAVAACDVLADGVQRAVDVAEIDGRTFLGIAGAGLDSDVQVIANRTRLPLGKLVYTYGALRALAAWRPARFDIELDGEPHTFTGFAVAACNSGRYGGGMQLAPDARLDDGLLDVVVSGDVSKLRFLRNLPKVFEGTHVDEPEVHVFRAREVRLACDRPFTAYADGDPIAELPATVRVVPGALQVLAPAQPG